MKKYKLYLMVIAALVIGYFGYNKFSNSSTTPTYQTATAEKGTLVSSLTESGTVTSLNNSAVLSDATGVVTKLYVKEGDIVKSGQKIAELELDQDSKQKYLSASANYQSAKNALASAQASSYSANTTMWVAHEKLMSDAVARSLAAEDPTMIMQNSDWNSAELKYKTSLDSIKQAQTSLSSASLALRQSSPTIFAPISGTVTGLTLQMGSVRTTSSKIASITTTAAPIIAVNLTEVDIPKVKVGNKVTVKIEALNKTYVGKVSSIDVSGTVSSNVVSYPTYIQLDSPEIGLLPNMTASASIITDTKENVIMVPNSSVKNSNGFVNIQVLKNGSMVLVPAEIGIQSDTQTEVVSGISEGETVVTSITQAAGSNTATSTKSAFSLPVRGMGGR